MTKSIIEQRLLGFVIIHFELVDKFLAKIKEVDFSDVRHRNLYKVFERLVAENTKTFDFSDLSVTHPKAIYACGGMDYLVELINSASFLTQFDSDIKALIKLSTIEQINNITKSASKLLNEDFDKGLDFIELSMSKIIDRAHKKESVDLYKAFTKSLTSFKDINIDFGFKTLHNILGYPHPGELLIVGARPGMGKTAFALACLFNYICSNQKKALMFSLEMSGVELFQRMISSVSEIPLRNIREGRINAEMKKVLDDNAKELASNKNLVLYDKTISTISALRAAIRKEDSQQKVGLVVVDYLQLLSGVGNNTYEKVSEISRQLKLIAREFNCTVLALSQLSRKVEERADKRPQLADLRESGAIEQDADYVLFLYRHNYYAKDPSINPKKEPLNIEVAKNRHGKVGTVQLRFDLTIGKFFDEVAKNEN